MAMIRCSECGREISDTALTCPGCGAPTAAKKRSNMAIADLGGSLIGMLIGAGLALYGIITMFSDINEYNDVWTMGGYNYHSPLSDHEVITLVVIALGVVIFASQAISAAVKSRKM